MPFFYDIFVVDLLLEKNQATKATTEMEKSKEPIRLRQRKMPTGITSLYLDIYTNGRRSYEYLKLYLVPEKTKADRDKNRETLRLAETIKAKRLVEFHNGEYGLKDAQLGKSTAV